MSSTALAPGHPDTISCQTPITVEQIVDQEADTFTVVLHVDARHVLPGLIRALSGHAADMLTIRTKPLADMTWHDAITSIAGDPKVRDALAVTLSPHQADSIGGDLVEAAEERRCDDCGELNDLTSGPTCSGCTQAAELLDARIAGALR
jgi:hypothetical protein